MRPKVSIVGQEADTVRIERPDGKAVDCYWRSDGKFVVYDMRTQKRLAEIEVDTGQPSAKSKGTVAMPGHDVLVVPPTRSRTGKLLVNWSKTHALDCKWALGYQHNLPYGPYTRMPASEVPAHVGGCARCGGGR